MLTLQVLSANPQLNTFTTTNSYAFTSGSDCDVYVRLVDVELKLRYIPISIATASIDLLKSDGTVLSKAMTYPFADDRSILKFSLTALESKTVISQNLVVTLTEGPKVSVAILKNGISKTAGDCC